MEVFYPYSPQKVWQVLTNRQALAAWLMENDFEPRLGHKFQFQHSTLPGLEGNIDCEVIELDEPRKLAFTWYDKMMSLPSIVTWTLKPVDGGTQLQLEHKQLRYKPVETHHDKLLHEPIRLYQPRQVHESKAVTPTLAPNTYTIRFPSISVGNYMALDSIILSYFINGGWDYKLKEKLPQVLIQDFTSSGVHILH
jgi:uncharacterized protein YndB with AHSA1/START domain